MTRRVLIWAVFIGWTWTSAVSAKPAVFSDLSYEDAVKVGQKQGRLVLVDAFAEWCGPCKQMDKDTWSNAEVVAWVKEHAIAIQVDVDQQAEVSEQLGIEAMPTVVVFKDGREIDRMTGYQKPKPFLEWMGALQRGETKMDRLKAQVAADENNVQARHDLASALFESKAFDEATAHYLWLWRHGRDRDEVWASDGFDYLWEELILLVDEREAAKGAIRELRDETAGRLKQNVTWRDFDDWIALNDILGDTAETVGWFDRVKNIESSAEAIERHADTLEYALIEQGRWSELLRLYPDPVAVVNASRQEMEQAIRMAREWGQDPQEMRVWYLEDVRDRAATMYAALLAADRDADAEKVLKIALEVDNTLDTKAAIAETALQAGEVRPIHKQWLAEVGPDSDWAELKQQVDAAATGP